MKITPLGAGRFALNFQYHRKLVELAKSIPGLTWDKELKAWCGYIDACNEFLNALPEKHPIPGPPGAPWIQGWPDKSKLRKYQQRGIEMICGQASSGVILADVMGLGKSVQALIAARELGGHVLIVCPSFVRGVWHKELAKWWPEAKVEGLEGLKPIDGRDLWANVAVCHYDIIHAHVEDMLAWGVNTIIIDEAHFLSNEKARRSVAAKTLAHSAKNRIALTGTPLTNRPRDLWNVVDTVSPGRFGSFFKYAMAHCEAHQTTVGEGPEAKAVWDFNGASELDQLKRRLSYFMLRRTHDDADVRLELPPKTRQVVEIKVPPGSRLSITRNLGAKDIRKALDVSADGKLGEVADMLRQHVEDGLKVVCFCYRRGVAERLANECWGEFIHGEVAPKERDRRIEACAKAPGGSLLTTTIDISSVGVDYSWASVGVFAELTYEPVELAQAEARLHRPGQERPVLIQYVVGLGTVDELVRQVCINKLDVIEKTIGDPDALAKGLSGPKSDEEALKELFEALG